VGHSVLRLYIAGLTLVSVFQTVFRRNLGHVESLDDREISYVRLLRCSATYRPLHKRMHLTCRAWVESLNTRDDDRRKKFIVPIKNISLHDYVTLYLLVVIC
jgi:hypothetical protein